MQQVSEENVGRAKDALKSLVDVAGTCEDPKKLEDQAVKILSEKLSDSPGLSQRVLQAFNSNKSISRFNHATDADRDKDFALIDVDKTVSRVEKAASAKQIKKFAALKPRFMVLDPQVPKTVRKTASAVAPYNPADAIEIDQRYDMMSVTIANTLKHQEDMLNKLAFAYDCADDKCTRALDEVEREAYQMPKTAKAEVVGIAGAFYGKTFNPLRDIFATDALIKKYASAPRCPDTPVYQKIEKWALYDYVRNNYRNLLKTAAADMAASIYKLAGAYNLCRLEKKADGGMVTGAVLGTVLPEALGLKGEDKASTYNKLMNPNVANVLRELELKRNFYEVYADDYISTFPIEQVQDAYNAAVQKLPDKLKAHPSSATQLIRSWVTKTLSHGGVVSAEDAADVMEAADKMRNETGGVNNPFRTAGLRI